MFNVTLATAKSIDCDPNGLYTIIVHDFNEDSSEYWISVIGYDFVTYRGGCVIAIDYSKYAKLQYLELSDHFYGIRDVLVKMMKSIGNPSRQLCFGQGVGARLCEKAGTKFAAETGTQIDRMELCDPAGEYILHFICHFHL